MSTMSVKKMNEIIQNSFSHVLFTYKGKDCGIDPFSMSDFDVWCGDDIVKAHSIEEISVVPIFEGKPLSEIITDITNIEY